MAVKTTTRTLPAAVTSRGVPETYLDLVKQ